MSDGNNPGTLYQALESLFPRDSSDEDDDNDDTSLGFKRKRRSSNSSYSSSEQTVSIVPTVTNSSKREDRSKRFGLPVTSETLPTTRVTQRETRSRSSGKFESLPTTPARNVKQQIHFDLKNKTPEPDSAKPIVKVTNKSALKGVLGAVRGPSLDIPTEPNIDVGLPNRPIVAVAQSKTIRSLQSILDGELFSTLSETANSNPNLTKRQKFEMSLDKYGNGTVLPENKVRYCMEPKSTVTVTETGRIDWDATNDEIVLEEVLDWMTPASLTPLTFRDLTAGRKIGIKKDDYDLTEDTNFASADIMSQLFESKIALHKMPDMKRLEARYKSNPFETIRGGIFMNRAAMKMANINYILNGVLTNPKTQSGEKVVREHDLLFFADVCAGPGGFSEYILWKKGWEAKGFGITLKCDENDFDLPNFSAGSPESFDICYGSAGDGNVLNPDNVKSFVDYVLNGTNKQGVHFMMADGGFAVDGIEEKQELLSKALVLSQLLIGLSIVRPGGHLVCKIFDSFTRFTVGLIYMVYHCFDLVAIHKPNSSRPANSERYLICKYKREQTDETREYLAQCQELLWNWRAETEKRDIVDLLPIDKLMEDPFFTHISKCNNSFAIRQIKALKKLNAFGIHPALLETRQKDTRAKCLELWGIPDEKRKVNEPELPNARFVTILKPYPSALLLEAEKVVTTSIVEQVFKSPYDWRFVIVEGDKRNRNRGFYFGMGGKRIYRFDNYVWRECAFCFEMSKDTLVFGEIAQEICQLTDTKKFRFHIIDAIMLGGKDVRGLHYTDRLQECAKFAKAMDKPGRKDLIGVGVKKAMRMECINQIFEKLVYRAVQPSDEDDDTVKAKVACPVDLDDEQSNLIHPSGILFMKITKEPWTIALSRSANRKYFFNTSTNVSMFDSTEAAIADFSYTTNNHMIWWWDEGTRVTAINNLLDDPDAPSNGKVHAAYLTRHVERLVGHGGK